MGVGLEVIQEGWRCCLNGSPFSKGRLGAVAFRPKVSDRFALDVLASIRLSTIERGIPTKSPPPKIEIFGSKI